MEKELNEILVKLQKANTKKDTESINKHVNELNKLWGSKLEEMVNNAKKDGYYPPKNTNNEN